MVIGALNHGIDRDGRAPARTQHTTEFAKAAHRIGKEHQSEIAEHRVEALVGEGKRLSVLDRHRHIRRVGKALTRLCCHRRGDVGGGDVAGRADRGEGRFGGKPGTGRDVENAHARRNPGGAQQEGHEVRCDMREGLVVERRCLVPEGQFPRHWHSSGLTPWR
jgi:hypothetical protein